MTPSTRHTEIMKHMLGMNAKRRQDWGGRNYFATFATGDDYPDMCAMERAGLVERNKTVTSEMHYFHVTDKGLATLGYERAHRGYLRKIEVAA